MSELKYYRKKPVFVHAMQWFRNGDHPNDATRIIVPEDGEPFKSEGEVVRYYRNPDVKGETKCKHCGATMHIHGWIDNSCGGRAVCPGDFIVTDEDGDVYPCKPDIFAATYDEATQPSVAKPYC